MTSATVQADERSPVWRFGCSGILFVLLMLLGIVIAEALP